jgi:hypothetical protein
MSRNRSRSIALAVFLMLVATRLPHAAPAGHFTISTGSPIVADNKTTLIWQQASSSTTYDYASAANYCSQNTPGLPGSGWRLPTVKELLTIVDDSATSPPTIDTTAFTLTQAGIYWTSTTHAQDATFIWGVDFSTGGSPGAYPMASSLLYLRCVR